ncbi:MAG: serine hydrolase [Candidatus Promineifilaceae bacterium]
MIQGSGSPGFRDWLYVLIGFIVTIFLLTQIYQYATVRQFFPQGLEVAGIDVSGMSREEAEEILTERYISAPIIIYHREQPIEISPAQAEFSLQFETMMTLAEQERNQQDFWAGFWGYFWGRPVDVSPINLHASHDPIALQDTIVLVANQLDKPAEPPKPVSGNMSFEFGAPGLETNIAASIDDVQAALYRAREREAHLVLEVRKSADFDISLLNTLITNNIQEFEARSGGVGSVFIIDLDSGQEVSYNSRIPMTGMTLLNIPIMVQTLRVLGDTVSAEQVTLFNQIATDTDPEIANLFLNVVAGQNDGFRGANAVSDGMVELGLSNTYLACPFNTENETRCVPRTTPANEINNPSIEPNALLQTTAEDIGLLLGMLYYCAERGGGALMAIYGDQISAEKCQLVIDSLATNDIGSLIEEGVPDGNKVAHRHGWLSDTYGDAGIVYSQGGDYVIVQFLHKPTWLAWEISSPLMADLSRATYNFFNFDEPFLSQR